MMTLAQQPFAQPPSDRIHELAQRVANGTYTDDDTRELEAIISTDLAARNFYLDYCTLHAELQLLITSDSATNRMQTEVSEKEGTEEKEKRSALSDQPLAKKEGTKASRHKGTEEVTAQNKSGKTAQSSIPHPSSLIPPFLIPPLPLITHIVVVGIGFLRRGRLRQVSLCRWRSSARCSGRCI